MVAYDADRCIEHQSRDIGEIEEQAQGFANVWIDVQGLGDLDTIRRIGDLHGLHPLTLEDIVTTVQRPKAEAYDDYLFVVLRVPRLTDGLAMEQLAMVFGEGFVVTFGERALGCLEPVRKRILSRHGRIRSRGAGYLAYALIDAVIDSYFPVLESYGERIEDVEAQILDQTSAQLIAQVHRFRHEIMEVRRAIWPLRDLLNTLMHDESPLIEQETRVFLRDCGDHVFQLLDMIEIHREVISVLLDLHLSSLSARMNEIMKVLTIIATIFIPLSFVASLYGMNFDAAVSPYNMPELKWRFGYPLVLLVMAAMGLGMLGYFWSKGWIGSRRKRSDGQGTKSDR